LLNAGANVNAQDQVRHFTLPWLPDSLMRMLLVKNFLALRHGAFPAVCLDLILLWFYFAWGPWHIYRPIVLLTYVPTIYNESVWIIKIIPLCDIRMDRRRYTSPPQIAGPGPKSWQCYLIMGLILTPRIRYAGMNLWVGFCVHTCLSVTH
jgi:hypothetical protein